VTDTPFGLPPAPPPLTDTPRNRLRLTPASAIEIRPVVWTWADRIPSGAITLVPGREGIGKSLFLAWLTAQITRGTLPGIHFGQPRPVIYAATEDSWSHTIAPRLLAAGADLDLVFQVQVERDGHIDQLTLPLDCAALAEEIRRLDVALLAADPLLSLIHAAINTHQDRDLRQALEPLARLADTTGCAVVGLAHFNKSASTDSLNLITGSRAFSAVARSVIAMARDTHADDGSCILSQAKSNLGRLDVPSLRYLIQTVHIDIPTGTTEVGKLVFTGETDRSVSDILGESADDADRRAELKTAAAWLADFLTNHGGKATRAQVAAAAKEEGFAMRTVQRACQLARVEIKREGFGNGAYWQLTTADPPADDDYSAQPDLPFAPNGAHSRHALNHGANGSPMARMNKTDTDGYATSRNGAVVK